MKLIGCRVKNKTWPVPTFSVGYINLVEVFTCLHRKTHWPCAHFAPVLGCEVLIPRQACQIGSDFPPNLATLAEARCSQSLLGASVTRGIWQHWPPGDLSCAFLFFLFFTVTRMLFVFMPLVEGSSAAAVTRTRCVLSWLWGLMGLHGVQCGDHASRSLW